MEILEKVAQDNAEVAAALEALKKKLARRFVPGPSYADPGFGTPLSEAEQKHRTLACGVSLYVNTCVNIIV